MARVIGHTIDQINWPIVFYICFGVAVLWVLHNLLGLSFTHFVRGILSEFRGLLGPGRITRAKVNALLIIALLCFTGFYAFVEPFTRLIELAARLQETESQRFFVEAGGVFLIAVVGILSVRAIPP